MENLKQKTFKAFAWDLGGKLADQGVSFLISIVLARLLAPEEFGLLAMAAVVIALAHVFIDSGLGTALIQRKEVSDAHYGSVFVFNVVVGSLLTLLFFSLSGVIADFYERPELKPIMQALSFNFIINAFTRVQSVWLTKQLNFGIPTRAQITAVAVSGGVGVTLAILNYGVWALVVQSLLGGITSNLYIVLAVKWRPKFIFNWKALKELWHFGGYILVARIFSTITEQIDKLIIGKIFSPSTLGFYQRSQSLNQFVNKYTSSSLMNVLFPTLSSIQDDKERGVKIIDRSLEVLSFITFFLVGLLYSTAKEFIVLLFSEKWLPSVPLFKIMMLAGFVYPLSSLFVNIIVANGNSKLNLKLGLIKQCLLITNLIVGFSFGLTEYLYGFVVVLYIALNLNIYFSSKQIEVPIVWIYSRIYKYLLAAMIAILTSNFINIENYYFSFIGISFTYTFIYLILTKIFNTAGLKYIWFEIKEFNYVRKKK